MSMLRKVLVIAGITALTAFGIAGCGGDEPSGTTATGGGGDINITLNSFPDYIDPQLSYTLEGWEVLWNVYTPLLTYKHEKGAAGTEVVPGLRRRACPRSPMTARPTS